MTDKNPAPTKRTEPERRALLRIDSAPAGKQFQGVWLEFPDDKRWVIDYRARGIWESFADAAVLVTGECYSPPAHVQSINAQHFRVHRMRFATPEPRGARPYIEIGPEKLLRGTFDAHAFPAGSKLAGSSEPMFVTDDGTSYGIVGTEEKQPPVGTAAVISAREVIPDMAHHAQTGGPKLWIFDVHGPDYTDEPDAATACSE